MPDPTLGVENFFCIFPFQHIKIIVTSTVDLQKPNVMDSGQEKSESESVSHSVMPDSLRTHGLYSPQNSLGQNTGVGSLSLLQGIFPTQGLNLGLPHCRQIPYPLSHTGSPGILEWVAYPFSSGFSQPRNQTRVSCFAGGFFTN